MSIKRCILFCLIIFYSSLNIYASKIPPRWYILPEKSKNFKSKLFQSSGKLSKKILKIFKIQQSVISKIQRKRYKKWSLSSFRTSFGLGLSGTLGLNLMSGHSVAMFTWVRKKR